MFSRKSGYIKSLINGIAAKTSFFSAGKARLVPAASSYRKFIPLAAGTSVVCSAAWFGNQYYQTKNKFLRTQLTLAADVASFQYYANKFYSDHFPITDEDALTLSWNTLQQCEIYKNEKSVFCNNGFGKVEDKKEYQQRRARLLAHLTGKLVCSINDAVDKVPVRVICLQEIQGSDKEIQASLRGDFEVARIDDKDNTISREYGASGCRLVMLHRSSLEPIQLCDLSHLNLDHPDRYLAVKFQDVYTKDEFVVVNVHQDFASVEIGKKPGLVNLKLIQVEFSGIPCIITGDFNSNNLLLKEEGGKIVKGVNTNLMWDAKVGNIKSQLGTCDHIIMNAKYRQSLLPKLGKNRNKDFDSKVYKR